MKRPQPRRFIQLSIAVALLALLAGCEKRETYELLIAGNGLVYRLNKTSGEISLIVGSQVTKMEEWRGSKKDEPRKNYLINWPEETLSQVGDIQLKLKTTWREGKMFYILEASP